MDDAIRMRGVHYRPDPAFALRDLDLTVPRGSIYGFLGANGSGKTTTIRLLLGMARPDQGEIRVLDRPIPEGLPDALERIGFVPERAHLNTDLTVAETLAFHGAFFPLWDRAAAEAMVDRMDLPRDRRVKRLSKGETGKLMMLLALSQHPELLVLDEPTDGLDPVVRRDILTAVLEYVSEWGATVFLSSHLVHEVERFCDRVGILDAGRLMAEMPVESFKSEIKRLRVTGAPEGGVPAPFVVLDRRRGPDLPHEETWIVRGWEDPMKAYFEGEGAVLREVVDLDLEEGFVELLRASRPANREG